MSELNSIDVSKVTYNSKSQIGPIFYLEVSSGLPLDLSRISNKSFAQLRSSQEGLAKNTYHFHCDKRAYLSIGV